MRKFITTLLMMTSTGVFAQVRGSVDYPYLETTATVDTLVVPDLIYLNILLSEKNEVSLGKMERRMITQLQKIGVDTQEQLMLSDLESDFRKRFLKQKDVVKSKAYSLKLNDAKQAGQVLVELERIGISNINLDKVAYSKVNQLQLEMKSKAVEKAKLQAEYLIRPLGGKVIRAIRILDRSQMFDTFRPNFQSTQKISSDDAKQYTPPQITFELIRIRSRVVVEFAID